MPWQGTLRSQGEYLPLCPSTHNLWYTEPKDSPILISGEGTNSLKSYISLAYDYYHRWNLDVLAETWHPFRRYKFNSYFLEAYHNFSVFTHECTKSGSNHAWGEIKVTRSRPVTGSEGTLLDSFTVCLALVELFRHLKVGGISRLIFLPKNVDIRRLFFKRKCLIHL